MEADCPYTLQIDIPDNDHVSEPSGQVLDDPPSIASSETHHVSPISIWLQNLGLSRYEEVFIREEIDWDSLKWLTDEDLYVWSPDPPVVPPLNNTDGKEMKNMKDAYLIDAEQELAPKFCRLYL
ncbi:uncharacterized protein LOC110869596 [Helianthus annuus]|uniref:uncharacterized protein LOC110869596 n=1 Tax=Helianthus annuus TaxID=4232 RepID=UPI000B8FDE32|nr:uncharacterized protein LOC110869596 [Helianthus annuus]